MIQYACGVYLHRSNFTHMIFLEPTGCSRKAPFHYAMGFPVVLTTSWNHIFTSRYDNGVRVRLYGMWGAATEVSSCEQDFRPIASE